MPEEIHHQAPRQAAPADEQYKQATKAVVDDMFRVDVLGPRICAVLENHTPASGKIKTIIAEAIVREPAIKEAIEGVVQDLDTKRKSRWIDRAVGAGGTILVGVVVGVVVWFITR